MEKKKKLEEIYKYFEDAFGEVPEHHKLLGKYNVDALEGFYKLRKATMKEPPEGALPRKMKELIIVAVETALRVPGAITHAKYAVDAGATPSEVMEAVTLSLWLAGMPSYVLVGSKAVESAEAEEKRKKEQK